MLASPSRRLSGSRIVSQVTSYVPSLREGGGAKVTSHASLVSSVRVRELSQFRRQQAHTDRILIPSRAGANMTPWWWLSVLIVVLPVYIALRRRRNIWVAVAACVVGLVLGAVLEGMLSVAYGFGFGETVTFRDAVAKATHFPVDFLVGLLLIVVGALNPEPLLLLPRIIEDILAGAAGSDLRRLMISLSVFNLMASSIVPFVAAIHGHRTVRWTVIAVGSLAVTAARIGAGHLHYKDQGIVVISSGPPWLGVIYDINWAIVALLSAFIQISLAYLILRALIYLARGSLRLLQGSGSGGRGIAPANVGSGPPSAGG